MSVLVLAIDRLDFAVIHSLWLPQFNQTIHTYESQKQRRSEQDTVQELIKLIILKRIFRVCLMQAGPDEHEAVLDISKLFDQSETPIYQQVMAKLMDQSLSLEQQIPWLLLIVSCTAPYGEAYEAFCDREFFKLFTEWGGLDFIDDNVKLATIAQGFAEDLTRLHPLSKLAGMSQNT